MKDGDRQGYNSLRQVGLLTT
ncbi:MAG: hypothetical protein FD129_2863, partial [bacterium]